MSPVLADGLLITAPPGKSWARILPCSIFELCNQGVRESVSKQVDKEPRGPQGERGLEFSRRKNKKKKDNILPEDSLWIKNLANSVILKCKLWE